MSVIEKNALDSSKIERLLQAKDANEARQILNEFGWPSAGSDEENAQARLQAGVDLIKELTTDDKLTDAFLVRYDIANLKILLKARSLGTEAEGLSFCGTLQTERLEAMVNDHRYNGLPDVLKEALDEIEKSLAKEVNPMLLDARLDQAHYALALSMLPKSAKTAREYFATRIDTLNCSMALRCHHAKENERTLKALLIEGGSISPAKWLKAYPRPESLPILLNKYGGKVYQSALAAFMDKAKLAAFERDSSDHLLNLFLPYKRSINQGERLIGHLLKRDREVAAVRLILAGKENGFPYESIKERLRELYV
jgi:V/A-type H+-transporting ATPase subunit C